MSRVGYLYNKRGRAIMAFTCNEIVANKISTFGRGRNWFVRALYKSFSSRFRRCLLIAMLQRAVKTKELINQV